ncbi:1-phosphofructokinase [Saccharomonospora piscinae]|uniref:1-phosphofructokinase n=1 Tax=Saccharomonospora piscinae TaxID=687388 RepID=A0A1V9A965_SACPI|nr:hexose kinase [Saccharomonospora piscinae]OQO93687.1 1-phosphofructokinase [Saccharomonospora piscinae]TLW94847.1 1-phosphofructokinase family hexose kinase [Saccharomonospora piscinae]
MILTITPNPALDVTYHLADVRWGEVNRVTEVTETAGGKGVNVARVLHQLSEPVSCTGFLGGDTGDRMRDMLAGLDQRWVPVPHTTRRTTAVVTGTATTLFNEPGAPVDEGAWHALSTVVADVAGRGDVVVLSGSMPPGTTESAVGELVSHAARRGARVVADTSGPLLRTAARAGAALVKPNQEELREATGEADVVAGAQVLLADGAEAVVVSLGEDGMLALTGGSGRPHRTVRARPSGVVPGNPTGAGDAAVAALARALHAAAATPLESVLHASLADAVALSAAAVACPVAGEVDLGRYQRERAAVAATTG